MKRKKRERARKRLGALFCTLVYLFLFLPISVIVVNSTNATTSKPYLSWKGFTLDWYVELFDNSALLESFGNTMVIALVSTLLATVIGTLGAVGMYRYKFKGKNLLDGLLYIPVVIPEIVLGISLLTIFALVDIPRVMLTLILAHVTFCVPYVIFNVRARLAGYDSSIEEASLDLGANRVRTFFEITLPVLRSVAPWFLVAYPAYNFIAMVALEPHRWRQLVYALTGYFTLSPFVVCGEYPGSYFLSVIPLAVMAVASFPLLLYSSYRFSKGL